MRKEIYYSLYDAERAADVYASEHNGRVVGMDVQLYPLRGMIDDRSKIDHEDIRFIQEVGCWSGEMAAVRVIDKDTFADIALFGYWDDEID